MLYVRHAPWCNFFSQSAKRRREIFKFDFLTTTQPSTENILCSASMKTVPSKHAKVHFAYFEQRDKHGIVAKHLPNTKSYFIDVFVVAAVLVSLKCHYSRYPFFYIFQHKRCFLVMLTNFIIIIIRTQVFWTFISDSLRPPLIFLVPSLD